MRAVLLQELNTWAKIHGFAVVDIDDSTYVSVLMRSSSGKLWLDWSLVEPDQPVNCHVISTPVTSLKQVREARALGNIKEVSLIGLIKSKDPELWKSLRLGRIYWTSSGACEVLTKIASFYIERIDESAMYANLEGSSRGKSVRNR